MDKENCKKTVKTDHLFKPGISGNPSGRPKGSVAGITKARSFIKDLMQDENNRKTIYAGLLKYMEKEPVEFFREFILEGKGTSVSVQLDGDIQRAISVNIMPPASKPVPPVDKDE